MANPAAQQNPGKFQPYDPSTPYQAPVLPDPQPAAPSPLPTQMPQANGAVKKSGAIATIADGMLRGFMQGRAYGQAKQAMTLKKKTDDLQNSYNQDAVRLYQLTQAGVSETSDEYKAAKSSVDGSWGALMDFYGGHIEQMTGNKKGRGKKDQDQRPPQAVLTDPKSTPFEKSQAWYQVSKQAGPPVYGQIAMINTPEAQAQRKARAMAVNSEISALEHRAAVDAAQATMDGLNKAKPQSEWNSEDRDKYNNAQRIVEESQISRTGTPRRYKRADGTEAMLFPSQVREDDEPVFRPTATDQKRDDYDKAKKDGYKGNFERWTAEEEAKGRREGAPPVKKSGGSGGGGAAPGEPEFSNTRAGKTSQMAYRDLKKRYSNLSSDDLKELADKAASSPKEAQDMAARASSYLSSDEKAEEYESGVLRAAMNSVVGSHKDVKNDDDEPFDIGDALTIIVGKNGQYYQYGSPQYATQKPDGGKYKVGKVKVGQAQMEGIEDSLQSAIKDVMGSKTKGFALPGTLAEEIRNGRFRPFLGKDDVPSPVNVREQSGATPPASPQAGAPSTAPPSSGAPTGGKKESKGTVKKSAFLKANPGSTVADWEAIKPQLKTQGYDPKDE